ncbi:MAG: hypothetical protein EXR65_04860 [Dehalococcoidia bacterium]|nr:hypothetical protein [Dehalococcoidia bacterium]
MRLSAGTGWNLGLAAAAVAALLVLGTNTEDAGIEIERRDPAPGIDELRVDVTGAVLRPGVVAVAAGERPGLLDLNRATAAQLEALPGIGPVYAGAIVSACERDGPFPSTDNLVARGVIPARVYEAIRDLVAVR